MTLYILLAIGAVVGFLTLIASIRRDFVIALILSLFSAAYGVLGTSLYFFLEAL